MIIQVLIYEICNQDTIRIVYIQFEDTLLYVIEQYCKKRRNVHEVPLPNIVNCYKGSKNCWETKKTFQLYIHGMPFSAEVQNLTMYTR